MFDIDANLKKVYEELGCIVKHLDTNKTHNELEKEILNAYEYLLLMVK